MLNLLLATGPSETCQLYVFLSFPPPPLELVFGEAGSDGADGLVYFFRESSQAFLFVRVPPVLKQTLRLS